MARTLPLAAALALLLACKLDPGGRCVFDAQCRAGLECTGGLCEVRDAGADLGASCAIDSDCVSWGTCRENVCVLEPGACVANGDCPSWQACGTDHKCALAAGKCASNADCVAWKSCSLTSYTCGLLPNRCDTATNCKTWQTCDGTNTCVAKAGFCDLASQCGTWQSCDTVTTHKCVASAGFCDLASQCGTWQSCDTTTTHQCLANAGFCDVDAQCQAWEACDATGTAPTHQCVKRPGACETTADCGPFRTCQSSACVTTDGTDVLLCGELTPGDVTTYALSLVGDPATPLVGFRANFGAPRLDAYGAILYVDPRWNGTATVDTLVRMVPDDLTWSGTLWQYPAAPTGNDVVIPTPNCAAGVIQRWIVRAGTGEVFHSCDPDSWYDQAGTVRFTEPTGTDLVAWNAGDAKLVLVLASSTYSVVDAAGGVHPLTGLPAIATIYGARTRSGGFWLALQNATTTDDELWAVDASGAATLFGAYPAKAGGIWALDDAGRAYAWTAGQVVRRKPDGATVETLYDASAGASVWTTDPATWWVSAAGPIFVTGP